MPVSEALALASQTVAEPSNTPSRPSKLVAACLLSEGIITADCKMDRGGARENQQNARRAQRPTLVRLDLQIRCDYIGVNHHSGCCFRAGRGQTRF